MATPAAKASARTGCKPQQVLGLPFPPGCLGGSCGACEIEVNGKVVRACISTVPPSKSGQLTVEFATDPYW
jgi:succinate dehydrogenase/fumarate reductase-like Fe-S protein